MAEPSMVRVEIINAAGRQIRVLAEREFSGGDHSLQWNGRGDEGHSVANGVYFIRVATGALQDTQPLVFLR